MYAPRKTRSISLDFSGGIAREYRPSVESLGDCIGEFIANDGAKLRILLERNNGGARSITLSANREKELQLKLTDHTHDVESIFLASEPARDFGNKAEGLHEAVQTWAGEDGPDLDNLLLIVKRQDEGNGRACLSLRGSHGHLEAAFIRRQ
jgi:hypothetical protein